MHSKRSVDSVVRGKLLSGTRSRISIGAVNRNPVSRIAVGSSLRKTPPTTRMSAVPFVCQRCKQPLRVHESLSDISPAAFDVLAGIPVVHIQAYNRKQHKQHQETFPSNPSNILPCRPSRSLRKSTEIRLNASRQKSNPNHQKWQSLAHHIHPSQLKIKRILRRPHTVADQNTLLANKSSKTRTRCSESETKN